MANLSVLSPGKWILDIFRGNIFRQCVRPFLDISTFFQKIRSGPLTLARQGSILAGAPTVPRLVFLSGFAFCTRAPSMGFEFGKLYLWPVYQDVFWAVVLYGTLPKLY